MADILMLANAVSCKQLIILFGVVSLFITIFLSNAWILLCYVVTLPAGVLCANQICSRTKFLDASAFLAPIWDIYQYCRANTVERVSNEHRHTSSTPLSECLPDTELHKLQTAPDHGDVPDISTCLDYIMRDFFESWYGNISTEPKCHFDARAYLETVFSNLFDKLSKADVVDMVHSLSVIYTRHLQDIHICIIDGKEPSINCDAAMPQDLHLIFQRIHNFHPAIEGKKDGELKYLRAVVEVLGHSMLPVDLYSCTSARHILLDILTKNVVLPLVNKISEPHWLHEALIKILSKSDTTDGSSGVQTQQQEADDKSRLNEKEDSRKTESDTVAKDDIQQVTDCPGNLHVNGSHGNVHVNGSHGNVHVNGSHGNADGLSSGTVDNSQTETDYFHDNGESGSEANTSPPCEDNLDLPKLSGGKMYFIN